MLAESEGGIVVAEKLAVSGEGEGARSDEETMKEDDPLIEVAVPIKGDYPMEETPESEGKFICV